MVARRIALFTLSILLYTSDLCAQQADSISIFFELNEHKLTEREKQKLKSWLPKEKRSRVAHISIKGFTDFIGSTTYNQQLSQKRANEVKRYLVAAGITEKQIHIAEGRGETPAQADTAGLEKTGIRSHRRVEINAAYTPAPTSKERIQITGPGPSQESLPDLKDVEVGETLVLRNMNFLPGRHFVTESSEAELRRLYALLLQNPKLKIEIQGHICCEAEGDGLDLDTGKKNLSESRAAFIYDHLVNRGISAKRLRFKGYGRSQPLIEVELTESHRRANRRVEIKILEK